MSDDGKGLDVDEESLSACMLSCDESVVVSWRRETVQYRTITSTSGRVDHQTNNKFLMIIGRS